ncbi:DUF4124 domain-containing protein [Marinobacter orientalis]|uniref:DUF4124 domain-containing protein n=1 Tax=Marinobacter orientalis TaxID=1928859 RepID=A0A7Y0RB26_9GAMM|nr:DUF4124 domain-containing protein [Marinobacter orientalis]NMT62191.1 DUF4124 domain-containing protein [Marinobacter orientalis]TGX50908.1 DUF4124 domain-containing protein [Marinobacter orientalis]
MSLSAVYQRLAVVIFLVFATCASADYYKWTDENGVTHFSDEPPGPDGKPVRPNGTTVIPMRENIRTQKRVEEIKNPKPVPSKMKPVAPRVIDSKTQWEEQQELREEKRQQVRCKNYEDRIAWIDSRLRAGGYSVGQGNRLREDRRELSKRRAWKCLRD